MKSEETHQTIFCEQNFWLLSYEVPNLPIETYHVSGSCNKEPGPSNFKRCCP